jgi:hypothetical protein
VDLPIKNGGSFRFVILAHLPEGNLYNITIGFPVNLITAFPVLTLTNPQRKIVIGDIAAWRIIRGLANL